MVRLRSLLLFDISSFGFRPVGDFTFSWSEEKVSKKTDTESLSNPNNTELSQRTSSYRASMRGMNLQQTSCLLLLKVIHCLGKLNDDDVVAALSKVVWLTLNIKVKRQDLTPLCSKDSLTITIIQSRWVSAYFCHF